MRLASSFSFTIVDVEVLEYVDEVSSKVLVEVVVVDLALLEVIVDCLFERGRRYIETVFWKWPRWQESFEVLWRQPRVVFLACGV